MELEAEEMGAGWPESVRMPRSHWFYDHFGSAGLPGLASGGFLQGAAQDDADTEALVLVRGHLIAAGVVVERRAEPGGFPALTMGGAINMVAGSQLNLLETHLGCAGTRALAQADVSEWSG